MAWSFCRFITAMSLLVGAGCSSEDGRPSSGPGGEPDGGADGYAFDPSNLPENYRPISEASVAFHSSCEGSIDTSTETLAACAEVTGGTPIFERLEVEGGAEIDVLVVDELTIDSGARVRVQGDRALLIVALGPVNINGTLEGMADPYAPAPGGAVAGGLDGLGLGAGRGSQDFGGGGASYCGRGGNGGGAQGGVGGTQYGNAAIVPLLGGSSGGANAAGHGPLEGNMGGGAIEIVSMVSITVSAGGVINVGGSGGYASGGGGGSGGAILLESLAVAVAGVLAANGGGGGPAQGLPATYAENGSASDTPAAGGSTDTDCDGNPDSTEGTGSAGLVIDGTPGVPSESCIGYYGSGGGGGAGRIRINTRNSAAMITGIVSPSLETECATQGAIATSS